MALDTAIAPHLQVPRTVPANTPSGYVPPFPAYSARFPKSVKGLTIAVLGAQTRSSLEAATESLTKFARCETACAPLAWDVCTAVDCRGYQTVNVILYWNERSQYDSWVRDSGFEAWWSERQPGEEFGWFKEVLHPPIDRFETIFSDNVEPEGAAHMRESVSGPVQEHVYWGSARDRLPIAQTDSIKGEGWDTAQRPSDTEKHRIKVPGRQNLCVIRSGQDWSNTTDKERKLYLETMHPVLVKGMDYLRDSGDEVGCISNRFMSVVTDFRYPSVSDRTFGLGYFVGLASLEAWSKEHKTHLDIFGRFLQYAKELDNNVSLRLFHEILVLGNDQQEFEYIGCHADTGLLAATRHRSENR